MVINEFWHQSAVERKNPERTRSFQCAGIHHTSLLSIVFLQQHNPKHVEKAKLHRCNYPVEIKTCKGRWQTWGGWYGNVSLYHVYVSMSTGLSDMRPTWAPASSVGFQSATELQLRTVWSAHECAAAAIGRLLTCHPSSVCSIWFVFVDSSVGGSAARTRVCL